MFLERETHRIEVSKLAKTTKGHSIVRGDFAKVISAASAKMDLVKTELAFQTDFPAKFPSFSDAVSSLQALANISGVVLQTKSVKIFASGEPRYQRLSCKQAGTPQSAVSLTSEKCACPFSAHVFRPELESEDSYVQIGGINGYYHNHAIAQVKDSSTISIDVAWGKLDKDMKELLQTRTIVFWSQQSVIPAKLQSNTDYYKCIEKLLLDYFSSAVKRTIKISVCYNYFW